jgi:tetratricopeptide (TPR) repeat protein
VINSQESLALIKEKLKTGLYHEVMVSLYNQPHYGHVPRVFFLTPRILHHEIRFENDTHNVARCNDNSKRIMICDCVIKHDAPVDNRAERKTQRGEMDTQNLIDAARDGDTRSMFYLAQTYVGINDFHKAIYWYTKYKEHFDQRGLYSEEYFQNTYMLGEMYKNQAGEYLQKASHCIEPDDAMWYRRRAGHCFQKAHINYSKISNLYHKRPEPWIALGDLAMAQNDVSRARFYYETAINATNPVKISAMFSDGPACTFAPHLALFDIYARGASQGHMGSAQKAKYHIDTALGYWPDNEDWINKSKQLEELINGIYQEKQPVGVGGPPKT